MDKILKSVFTRLDPETKKPIEKSPELKKYLLLIYATGDDEDRTFQIITGRSEAREYLISNLSDINILNSLVVVEDVTLEDSISVLEFLKYIQAFYDDDFDEIIKEIESDLSSSEKKVDEDNLDKNDHENESVNNFQSSDQDV